MIVSFDIDMTLPGTSSLMYIPTGDNWDCASIQTEALDATTFNSGVITVRKTNDITMTPVDLDSTPITITAPGMKELVGSTWHKAGYLVLVVTTAASSRTIVKVSVSLRNLGYQS